MNTSSETKTNYINATIGSILAHSLVAYLLATITNSSAYSFLLSIKRVDSILNALKTYTLLHAYYVWSNKSLLFASRGYAVRSGIADIRQVVYIIVAFLIAAILFPIAMAQVTAATTTSWGQGVAPVFVSLLPILVIIAIALHFFGMY